MIDLVQGGQEQHVGLLATQTRACGEGTPAAEDGDRHRPNLWPPLRNRG